MIKMTNNQLIIKQYQSEVTQELNNILDFWTTNTYDEKNGGFIGKMDNNGQIDFDAPKGLVLNARILWTFSAAYKSSRKAAHLAAAQRAYAALFLHFKDPEFGGYYWSIQPNGGPLSMRKQIYGLAFALYGLSEFYQISASTEVKNACIEVFNWIEKHSFNPKNGGYLEAVARDGSPLEDVRLSPKDRNDPLSMNTHLHILEAYTNLNRIWQNDALKQQTKNLIDVFLEHIINSKTKHLTLFFDNNWLPTDTEISYGHDIEAAWLVLEAAEIVDYKVAETQKIAVQIAHAAAKGLNTEGSLDYEKHRPERHWWVQAEAMVGFLNAYELSNDTHFLDKSIACWDFTKRFFIDHTNGEWFWGYTADGQLMRGEDKVGFWKCPYHNARACMEVGRRLGKIVTTY
jgi:cellobiose epimerase